MVMEAGPVRENVSLCSRGSSGGGHAAACCWMDGACVSARGCVGIQHVSAPRSPSPDQRSKWAGLALMMERATATAETDLFTAWLLYRPPQVNHSSTKSHDKIVRPRTLHHSCARVSTDGCPQNPSIPPCFWLSPPPEKGRERGATWPTRNVGRGTGRLLQKRSCSCGESGTRTRPVPVFMQNRHRNQSM